MKIYVHIGSDKTGTTAIQAALKNNRKHLKEHGMVYPSLEKEPHQEALARELLTGKKGAAWEKLEAILNQSPDHLILSSEMFCSISESAVQLFKEWLGDHDVTIVAYLRSADQYLESGVMQRLKASKSDQDFFRLYRKIKWIPALFNPMVYISGLKPRFVFRWARAFGEKNIRVRPYSEAQWKDGNLISDFMATIGLNSIQESLQHSSQKRNVTPNIYAVYAMASFWSSTHPPIRHRFSEVMTRQYDQVKTSQITSNFKRNLARLISEPTFSRISREFGCPKPSQNDADSSNYAPSEKEIIQQGQKLLLEFSVHQQKRIKALEKNIHLKGSKERSLIPGKSNKLRQPTRHDTAKES
ncbi:hypothetical protein [Microbulbifer aggregans]|uniref:hypothetical protein n=1 Tax=Microbulbifer aggregans TaxID=1769779 RepID=UPI001CFCAB46|nr:hypothetical protein [Microbulbifer aggregans]